MSVLSHAGSWTGAAALAALLLSAALAARVPGWDRPFGGLTRLWRVHHLLGAAAFLLALAHPLLVALGRWGDSPRAAADALLPASAPPAFWLGWAALLAMSAFLAPTFGFFGSPDYRRWKALHALSGLAVLLALAHAWPLRRLTAGPWGAALWAALGAAAVGAFLWRKLFSRRLSARACVVEAVTPVLRGVVELSLRPERPFPPYRAGQFVYLTPEDPALASGRGEEHPFTLTSAPDEPVLRLAVKDLGDATRALQALRPGTRARVEGPYGGLFPDDAPPGPELWLAAGIGVAPFLARARALKAGGGADAVLVYCVQDATRAHFLDELRAIAAGGRGLRLAPHFHAEHGRLSRDFLARACPDFAARAAYACGPAGFVAHARAGLGLDPSRLRAEDFAWL